MYCLECERFFDEPVIERDDPSPRGLDLPCGSYTTELCPYCGSDWIEESHECKCGNEIKSDEQFCDDCKETLGEHFAQVKKELRLTQNELEDLITEYFGW